MLENSISIDKKQQNRRKFNRKNLILLISAFRRWKLPNYFRWTHSVIRYSNRLIILEELVRFHLMVQLYSKRKEVLGSWYKLRLLMLALKSYESA